MEKFRIAVSGDFRKADGTPTYPSFDLSPITENPRVELVWVDPVDGAMPPGPLEDCDALILLTSRFGPGSAPKGGRLALVARFGVGYDSVDIPTCDAHAIALTITPDGVRRPVAVSIITYVLALSQKLLIKDRLCRQGPEGWARRGDHMGVGLVGKTLGQLGLGNIGAETFRLAAPFGMRLIAHDPYANEALARELGVELVGSGTLFAQSDFLSVSVPLSEATRHYVNAARLATMKPTAFLINTARGPVVDQRALHEALVTGRIAGAGLDVFEAEPCPADEPLLALGNVIVTPHALCWTDECFAGNGAADIAAAFAVMRGETPTGIVNGGIRENPAWTEKLRRYARAFG
jgi:D-3-phosphoglycerate dehydrogenase